jgi:hypothetical protein
LVARKFLSWLGAPRNGERQFALNRDGHCLYRGGASPRRAMLWLAADRRGRDRPCGRIVLQGCYRMYFADGVCRAFSHQRLFAVGAKKRGNAIDRGAEPGIGRAILIGAALPSRRSAKLKCRSPAGRALGQAILIYLAIASSPVTAQDAQPGRATFAEMVAFARVGSVASQRLAPDVEGFHALALLRLIKPPLTDKAIVVEVLRRQN